MLAGTNWNEWVGVGTLALAFSTVILAFVTAAGVRVANRSAEDTRKLAETAETEARAVLDQAAATREQAEAARLTLLSSIQPLLGPTPLGEFDEADPDADIGDVKVRVHEPNMFVSLPLRNVGTGVALITRVVFEADDVQRRAVGTVSQTAVPVGEQTRLGFSLSLDDDRELFRADPMWAVVHYTDSGGQQQFRTRAAVRETYHNVLEVTRVDVHRADEAEPFLTIGAPIPWLR